MSSPYTTHMRAHAQETTGGEPCLTVLCCAPQHTFSHIYERTRWRRRHKTCTIIIIIIAIVSANSGVPMPDRLFKMSAMPFQELYQIPVYDASIEHTHHTHGICVLNAHVRRSSTFNHFRWLLGLPMDAGIVGSHRLVAVCSPRRNFGRNCHAWLVHICCCCVCVFAIRVRVHVARWLFGGGGRR